MLWVVSQFGFLLGFEVSINPFTALTAGLLGVPGVALVIMLNILL
jgi:inhibitor of the pro-sigma K processing machinery